MEPTIIFEDDEVCVIDKPAGMVVNDAETVKDKLTVQKWFARKLPITNYQLPISEFAKKGGVVHRLDKDTSGVMILAKTEKAYEYLKHQFLERKASKKYLALVSGWLKEKEGILSAPIERNPNKKQKFYVGTDLSRTAITEWKVLREYSYLQGNYCLVELKPHTGRTHQLRVHMKHLGHPIVGDVIYAGRRELEISRSWCSRMWLHAQELKLRLPNSGDEKLFMAEIPAELTQTLEKLIH